MDFAIIAFSSSTAANRLKKLALERNFYGVTIQQTPRALSQNGCSYSIRCPISTLTGLLGLADSYGVTHGYVNRESVDAAGRTFYQRMS